MCFIYKRNPESQQNYNRKINFKTDLVLETHHPGDSWEGGTLEGDGEEGGGGGTCPSILCGDRKEEKAHLNSYYTQKSWG